MIMTCFTAALIALLVIIDSRPCIDSVFCAYVGNGAYGHYGQMGAEMRGEQKNDQTA